jgi:chondroitin AC lyase
MDLRRGPLQARKAWFSFDDFYFCLGTGIRSVGPQASDDDIATDINQTLSHGTVQLGPRAQSVTGVRSGVSDANTSFVLHDQVGYLLWPGTHFVVSSKTQDGAWSDIGTGPRTSVSRQVFNLWIDHGSRPSNSTYAYAVFPSTDPEKMSAAASAPPVLILANTEAQQGVYGPSAHLVSLIFYTAGTVHTPLGDVTVDKPSMVLVHQLAGRFTVQVSEPTHQTTTVHVSVGTRSGNVPVTDGKSATLHL